MLYHFISLILGILIKLYDDLSDHPDLTKIFYLNKENLTIPIILLFTTISMKNYKLPFITFIWASMCFLSDTYLPKIQSNYSPAMNTKLWRSIPLVSLILFIVSYKTSKIPHNISLINIISLLISSSSVYLEAYLFPEESSHFKNNFRLLWIACFIIWIILWNKYFKNIIDEVFIECTYGTIGYLIMSVILDKYKPKTDSQLYNYIKNIKLK